MKRIVTNPKSHVYAIDGRSLENILSALKPHWPMSANPAGGIMDVIGSEPLDYDIVGDTAVLRICGPMTKHMTCMSWLLGGTSTFEAKAAVARAASNPLVSRICMVISSGGGEVFGTSDLGDAVRRAASVKPVVAYIEDIGCSAAYWVASQCDEVYCNPSAMVGSIGVYMVVEDMSAVADASGVNVHVIRDGKYKGAGYPGSEVTQDHLDKWQSEVNAYGDLFREAVMAGRGLDEDAVSALSTGEVWIGQAAVDAGLADGIASLEDIILGAHPSTTRNQAASAPPAIDTGQNDTMSETTIVDKMKSLLGMSPGAGVSGGNTVDASPGAAADLTSQLDALKAQNAQLQVMKAAVDAQSVDAFVDASVNDALYGGKIIPAQAAAFKAIVAQAVASDGGGSAKVDPVTGKVVTGAQYGQVQAFLASCAALSLSSPQIPDGTAQVPATGKATVSEQAKKYLAKDPMGAKILDKMASSGGPV